MGALACGFHTVEAAGDKAELREKNSWIQTTCNERWSAWSDLSEVWRFGIKVAKYSLYLLICVSLLFWGFFSAHSVNHFAEERKIFSLNFWDLFLFEITNQCRQEVFKGNSTDVFKINGPKTDALKPPLLLMVPTLPTMQLNHSNTERSVDYRVRLCSNSIYTFELVLSWKQPVMPVSFTYLIQATLILRVTCQPSFLLPSLWDFCPHLACIRFSDGLWRKWQ